MNRITRIAIPAILAAATLASPALAQPADLPTYQGRLTDNGQPANGTYEINVNYYDSAVGGNWLTGNGYYGVVVTDGLFMIPLAAYEFPSFGSDLGEIWLELEVRPGGSFDPFSLLSPRQIVTRAPLAHRAINATNADNADAADFALTSGTGLTDAYLNDPTIFGAPGTPVSILGTDFIVGNGVQIGQPALTNGLFELYSSYTPSAIVEIGPDGSAGGFIRVNQALNGSLAIDLEADNNGGGYFAIASSSDGGIGFLVDGNYNGNQAPRVSVYGASGIHTEINASITSGTNSVLVPEGAFDDFELYNEPGVSAARRNAANTALTSSASNVLARTITPPAAGFLVMNGVAEISINHTLGSTSVATAGIRYNGSSAYFNGIENGHRIPASAPSGTYIVVIPVHDVAEVSNSIARNVSLSCEIDGGTGIIVDTSLSVIYVPTAYGNTAGSVMHDPTRPENAPSLQVLRPEVYAAEREAERQWSQQQLLNRMARLEARLTDQDDRIIQQESEIQRLQNLGKESP